MSDYLDDMSKVFNMMLSGYDRADYTMHGLQAPFGPGSKISTLAHPPPSMTIFPVVLPLSDHLRLLDPEPWKGFRQ
jgi:hypothetical protein